ncbi:uncharacterized protein LOC135391325 isoform X3 [Ornithodoros turicata]|uniref:uncharacterized protein LOC135391325 isoform X3 n=1 Tax=Ornithodoros turicata TaxID=34597 RepID=UPI00313A3007
MSYPVSNTSDFTYLQMEVVAQARSDRGIHIILTNPLVTKKVSSGGEVTVCHLPRGIENGTTQTHVFRLLEVQSSAKYRFRKPDGSSGDNSGTYMEYYITPGTIDMYQRVSSNDPTRLACGTTNMKAPTVLKMDVKDDGKMKVSCNGVTATDIHKDNFGSEFVLQRIDQQFDSMTVMEIHVTYKSDRNKVFNTSADFQMPDFPLSPGAYIVWEGDASGTFTVKYNGTQIYTATKHASGLRLVMEMFITTILIGLDGEQTTCVANPKTTGAATNTKHPLVLSSGFHLTNFTMQTGSR